MKAAITKIQDGYAWAKAGDKELPLFFKSFSSISSIGITVYEDDDIEVDHFVGDEIEVRALIRDGKEYFKQYK